MGTTYSISYNSPSVTASELKKKVDAQLRYINQLMSTYIANSELNQFNDSEGQTCFSMSPETLMVLSESLRIYQLSEAAFNPAIGPLIEAWGFDRKETGNTLPAKESIEQILKDSQFDQLQINQETLCAFKPTNHFRVNLSAIAKGYAVDVIADLLENLQIENYLVEIGGEVRVKGNNSRNTLWSIAIENPTIEVRSIENIIPLKNMSIATSGDYRNYFEKDGKRYSHTIDPTTGYPIEHRLASISVLHPSAMTADGLATAIMVMGEEKGLDFAEKHQIAAYFLVKSDNGFIPRVSSQFKLYLASVK